MKKETIAVWSVLTAFLLLTSTTGVLAGVIDKDYDPFVEEFNRIAEEEAQQAAQEQPAAIEAQPTTIAEQSSQPNYLFWALIVALIAVVAAMLWGRRGAKVEKKARPKQASRK